MALVTLTFEDRDGSVDINAEFEPVAEAGAERTGAQALVLTILEDIVTTSLVEKLALNGNDLTQVSDPDDDHAFLPGNGLEL